MMDKPNFSLLAFAVHQKDKLIALSDKCLHPKIYIYRFPLFLKVTEFEGGGKLECQALLFSPSDYLISISGIPDYELSLW
uniref:Cilia- and flagella-associated protein 43 n=1 Tax=Octopus bimaculoides TaxID=37653 RepID=A0A0L8FH89_OCTBM